MAAEQPVTDGSKEILDPSRSSPSTKTADTSKTTERGMSKLRSKIPDWVVEGVKTRRTWKTFVRCMIAFFVTLVLLLDHKTLRFLGQAAFFSLITAVMLPPSMALSIYIFALATLILGMGFGWAWGSAAMAAGLRARDQVLLQQQVQTAQSGFDPNANLDAQYQKSIFKGDYLDPRSSAVFGVFMFVGAYMLGFIRATKPRLTLMCVFASIIMDVMCCYGPLFPIAQYTIARILLIPAALYIAIASACTLLIFPQSLSHIFITDLVKTDLRPLLAQLKIQDDVMSSMSSDEDRVHELAEKVRGLRKEHVAGVMALEGQVGMLQLEITRSQMGAGDLTKVFHKVKDLGARAFALTSFVLAVDDGERLLKKIQDKDTPHPSVRVKKGIELIQSHRHHGTNLDELLPTLASSTADLRAIANKSFGDAIEWLEVVNHSRWTRPPGSCPDIASRQTNLSQLKETLQEFRLAKQFQLLEPFRDMFDEAGNLRPNVISTVRWSTTPLFRCHVFTSGLIFFVESLIELLESLLEIEKANPKSRIQLPSAFAKMLVKSANETNAAGNPLDLGTSDHDDDGGADDASSTETLVESKHPDKKKEKKTKAYPKDPDANDPTNAFQRFGRKVATLWKALCSPQGIFALKYGLVSVALWIPSVCKSSAYFVYLNRGLWALIMAQTGLGVFNGEQIASFFVRMAGTILGLVIGMVVWYIGAPGTGHGNPYGLAAATMVFIAPFLYLRIIAPIQSMAFWLMTGVTIVFVVGYSWVDEHIFQLANSGSGAGLAGRRALLVLIGFTAAFIIMLFPRPLSARQVVRHKLAKTIGSMGDLYSRVLTAIQDETRDVKSEIEMSAKLDAEAKVENLRNPFLKIFNRMLVIQQQMAFASAEPGLKGPWPKEKYEAAIAAQRQITSALALLTVVHARLRPQWCRWLESSDSMHPAFVADCLALFSLLHQTLSTGQPMPPTMPIFERLAYHSMHRARPTGVGQWSNGRSGGSQGAVSAAAIGEDEDVDVRESNKALEILGQRLTWDLCHDEQLSIFATANVALVQITNGLNELQGVVISLVGEQESSGFDRAQEWWGRYEMQT